MSKHLSMHLQRTKASALSRAWPASEVARALSPVLSSLT